MEDIEELNKIAKNPNLKLLKTFPAQECPNKDIMCSAASALLMFMKWWLSRLSQEWKKRDRYEYLRHILFLS